MMLLLPSHFTSTDHTDRIRIEHKEHKSFPARRVSSTGLPRTQLFPLKQGIGKITEERLSFSAQSISDSQHSQNILFLLQFNIRYLLYRIRDKTSNDLFYGTTATTTMTTTTRRRTTAAWSRPTARRRRRRDRGPTPSTTSTRCSPRRARRTRSPSLAPCRTWPAIREEVQSWGHLSVEKCVRDLVVRSRFRLSRTVN